MWCDLIGWFCSEHVHSLPDPHAVPEITAGPLWLAVVVVLGMTVVMRKGRR